MQRTWARSSFKVKYMWPDWASRQLETSPCTEMSVKFLARRSRILPVNSLTVNVLRSGMRLKVSCCVIEDQCRRLSKIRRGNNARVPRGAADGRGSAGKFFRYGDFAEEGFASVDGERALESGTGESELPVVKGSAAEGAGEGFLGGVVIALESAHEDAFTVHNFVTVQFQRGRGGFAFVRGDFVDHMLVVARGIGNSALGFPFPGAEDFGGWSRRLGLRRRGGAKKERDSGNDADGSPNAKWIPATASSRGKSAIAACRDQLRSPAPCFWRQTLQ